MIQREPEQRLDGVQSIAQSHLEFAATHLPPFMVDRVGRAAAGLFTRVQEPGTGNILTNIVVARFFGRRGPGAEHFTGEDGMDNVRKEALRVIQELGLEPVRAEAREMLTEIRVDFANRPAIARITRDNLLHAIERGDLQLPEISAPRPLITALKE